MYIIIVKPGSISIKEIIKITIIILIEREAKFEKNSTIINRSYVCNAVLLITVGHRTKSGQLLHLSSQSLRLIVALVCTNRMTVQQSCLGYRWTLPAALLKQNLTREVVINSMCLIFFPSCLALNASVWERISPYQYVATPFIHHHYP